MRKIVLYAVVVALLAVLPIPFASAGTITHTVTYDPASMTTGTDTLGGVTYTTVHYEGLYNDGIPGMPSLPVDYIRFSVPWNATDFTVEALPMNDVSTNVGYPVYPCQQHTTPPTLTLPDSAAYYSGTGYPSQKALVVSEGILAGENRIVTVAVLPVTYRHTGTGQSATDVLTVPQAVSVTLGFDLGNNPVLYPVNRRDTVLRNKDYGRVRELVVNPDDVRSNSLSQSSGDHQLLRGYYPEVPDVVENPLTYLIVATPESLKPMRRLAALRRQKGMNVKIVTLSEAVTDPLAGQGDLIDEDGIPTLIYTDDAGKLRQYIRMHYYYGGTQYVLLAGTGVPDRAGDWYYSGMDMDWMTYIDYYGELNVGRLLGTQKEQFDNYTDKLLRYELNPGNGDYSYLKKAIATEGVCYPGDGRSGCLSPTFTTITQVFPVPGEIEVYGCDVIDSINTNHYGLMTSFNDAYPTGINLYADDDDLECHYIWAIDSVKVAPGVNDNETGNGLNLMDNKDYPMVYLSFFGQTIPYSNPSGFGSCINYGESFTTGKDYGGPAYLGMTQDLSVNDLSAPLAQSFQTELTGQHTVLGQALVKAKSSLQPNNTNYESVMTASNLLGDPALDFWTDLPQSSSAITVSRTDNSMTVTGLPTGVITVAYHSNDGETGLKVTSASTITLNDVSPNSTVMVYRHNFIPFIAPLVLQNTDLENSQYVIADDVMIGYDVDSGRTSGNVSVKNGADYEIEASGDVTIPSGFEVELGASFSVYRSTFK